MTLLAVPLVIVGIITTLANWHSSTPRRIRAACGVLAPTCLIGLFFVLPWQWALTFGLLILGLCLLVALLGNAEQRFQQEWRTYVGMHAMGEPVPDKAPRSAMVAWALAHNRSAAEALASVALTAMAASCESCGLRPGVEPVRFADGAEFLVCTNCMVGRRDPRERAS
jgi:hypothetical protein